MLNFKRLICVSASIAFVTLSIEAYSQDAPPPNTQEKQTETAQVETLEAEKPKKITDRKHPDYIRCRKEPVIGSLSRKRKICMTNKQWKAHIRKGNSRANELVEENRPGATFGQ